MDVPLQDLPPARDIPAAFAASLRSWWNTGEKESAIAEERLLRRLPFFRSAAQLAAGGSTNLPVVATTSKVALATRGHYLNMLSIKSTVPVKSDAPPPAVVLHGYGAGLGFFFPNYPALADWAGRRGTSVYALDWLGMGRSARVPFTVKAKQDDRSRVTEAEAFFIDALEEWRIKMELPRITLIGHSLGAYLSTAYALKYPDRVHQLILLSPAGVPHGPEDTSEPSRELADDRDASSSSGDETADGRPKSIKERSTFNMSRKSKVDQVAEEQKAIKAREPMRRKVFTYLWEQGFSPFQVARSSLFFGPLLIGKYSSRRFPSLTEDETRDFHDYILNITLAKGSGEYCISHLLKPGAFARLPLVDRVHGLRKDLPVTFAYGSHDWMDVEGGQECVKVLRQLGNKNASDVVLVDRAGHHLYIDNQKVVNKMLVDQLDRYR
jgi:cardiolipin-specific phospholipase